jgi:hypothetical protein
MDISNLMQSRYLRADQMSGQTQTFTIDRVTVEEFGQGELKPVVYLGGISQGFVLNQTNRRVIAKAYSSETGNWVGKPITLFGTTTPFRGQMVPSIGVSVPPANPRPVPEPEKEGAPLPVSPAAGAAALTASVDW